MRASVLIRADASLAIGSGHVMRCLALAEAMRGRGATCHFYCRAHPGHLAERITAAGHRVTLLPMAEPVAAVGHSGWLGASWQDDAEQCLAAFEGSAADWLVVDHYGLDARWESRLRPHASRIMAIDDLADRPHDCDLLLDQNLGRQVDDYLGLVPSEARVFIGPKYALLRPEFAALREYSLARRRHPELRQILVTMGGVDRDNATGKVLEALARCRLPVECRVVVVMGVHAPWLDRVCSQAQALPFRCDVRVDVADMAKIMADSDLCLGAAGGTSWERCALGLPAILMTLADNQAPTAQALAVSGASLDMGDTGTVDHEKFKGIVTAMVDAPQLLAVISERAREIADGKGCERIADMLMVQRIAFRNVKIADRDLLYKWRNHPLTREHFFDPSALDEELHSRWLIDAIDNPARILLICTAANQDVGVLRFDIEKDTATVSIYLDPQKHGKGLGRAILAAGNDWIRINLPRIQFVNAEVRSENKASLSAFVSAGYKIHHTSLQFVIREEI